MTDPGDGDGVAPSISPDGCIEGDCLAESEVVFVPGNTEISPHCNLRTVDPRLALSACLQTSRR